MAWGLTAWQLGPGRKCPWRWHAEREGLKGEISWPQLALPGRSFTSAAFSWFRVSPWAVSDSRGKDIDATSQWEGGQRTCRFVANPPEWCLWASPALCQTLRTFCDGHIKKRNSRVPKRNPRGPLRGLLGEKPGSKSHTLFEWQLGPRQPPAASSFQRDLNAHVSSNRRLFCWVTGMANAERCARREGKKCLEKVAYLLSEWNALWF